MELEFFPIDISYETNVAGRAAIQLFGRTINGEKICVIDPNFEPYFYAVPEDPSQISRLAEQISLLSYEEDNSRFFVTRIEQLKKKISRKDIESLKIYVNHPRAVPQLKRDVKSINGIKETREADLLFIRRYLIDKNLAPSLLTKVDGDLIERSDLNVDLVIRAKEVKQIISSETNEKLKLLAFDIEVYTNENQYPSDKKDPILMISLVGNNFKKVITWKRFNTNNHDIEFVNDESELILRFKEIILEYNPDYLMGYFSDGFDFPYINARAKINRISLIFNNHKLKVLNKAGETSCKILGISHLDIFKFIKNIMSGSLRLDNYTLNNVASELLKETKIDLRPDLIGKAWDLGNEEIEKYCEYNLQDSNLVFKLAGKIVPNIEELVRLTSIPAFDVCRISYSQLVEGYLIKCSKDYNELYPNKPDRGTLSLRKTQTYQGAFVFNPSPGLYENIVVFDFLSLYPSIVVSHNICTSTLLNEKEENAFETPEILENNSNVKFYFTSKYDGFIPSVLKDVLLKRTKIKSLLKQDKDPILESRSYALKTIANATYGYFAFFGARWYSKECAMSITSFGRRYIQEVIEKAQNNGIKVLYSDSITKDRFVTILDKNGYIKVKNIEELFNENKNKRYGYFGKQYIPLSGYKALTLNPNNSEPEWRSIKRIIRHKTNKKMYRVNQKYGESITTEDHSFIANGLMEYTPLELKSQNLAMTTVQKIPTVKKIKQIDLFELIKNYNYSSIYKKRKKISYAKADSDWVWFGWTNRKIQIKVKRYIKVGSKDFESLCRIIAYYITEGSSSTPETTKSRLGASISNSNIVRLKQLQEDYYNLFINVKSCIIPSMNKKRLLNYKVGNISKSILYDDKTYKLQMMNALTAVLFKSLCGQKSKGKKLPDFIYHVPNKYKKLLLDNLVEGDGSRVFGKRYSIKYHKNNFKYTTSSLELISGLSLLLRQLNMNYSIQHRPSKNSYSITTSTKSNKRLSTKVSQTSYTDYVYDLEVEGSHMFVDSCGQVLLHNTDSIFIALEDKSKDFILDFIKQINIELPSFMELELENFYTRAIFVMKKGENEEGAKKKYALITEEGKVKVRGFETIRRDWSYIAKETQKKVLEMILKDKDIEGAFNYTRNIIEDLKNKKIPWEMMVIRTQLKKAVEDYNLIGPHVIIAKKMIDKGLIVAPGSVIRYIVEEGKGLIRDKAILPEESKSYDSKYYIENQVLPAVDKIFESVGYETSVFTEEKSQLKLKDFLK